MRKHYDIDVCERGHSTQNGWVNDPPVEPETAQSGLVAAGSLLIAGLLTIIMLIVVFNEQIVELARYFLGG